MSSPWTKRLEQLREALRQRDALGELAQIESKYSNIDADDNIQDAEYMSELLLVQTGVVHGKPSKIYRQLKETRDLLFQSLNKAKEYADKADGDKAAGSSVAFELNLGKMAKAMQLVTKLAQEMRVLTMASYFDRLVTERGLMGLMRSLFGMNIPGLLEELRSLPGYKEDLEHPNRTLDDLQHSMFPTWKQQTQTHLDGVIKTLLQSMTSDERRTVVQLTLGEEEEKASADEFKSEERHPASILVSAMSSGKKEELKAQKERMKKLGKQPKREETKDENKEKSDPLFTDRPNPGKAPAAVGARRRASISGGNILLEEAQQAVAGMPGVGLRVADSEVIKAVENKGVPMVDAASAAHQAIQTKHFDALLEYTPMAFGLLSDLVAWWTGATAIKLAGNAIWLVAPLFLKTMAQQNGLLPKPSTNFQLAMFLGYHAYCMYTPVLSIFSSISGSAGAAVGDAAGKLVGLVAGLPAGTAIGGLVQSQAAALAAQFGWDIMCMNMLLGADMVVLPWLDATLMKRELQRVEAEHEANLTKLREMLGASGGKMTMEEMLQWKENAPDRKGMCAAFMRAVTGVGNGYAAARDFLLKPGRISFWARLTLRIVQIYKTLAAIHAVATVPRSQDIQNIDAKTQADMVSGIIPTSAYNATARADSISATRAVAEPAGILSYFAFGSPSPPPNLPQVYNPATGQTFPADKLKELYEVLTPATEAWFPAIFTMDTASLLMKGVSATSLNTWLSFFGSLSFLWVPAFSYYLRKQKALPVTSVMHFAAMMPQIAVSFGAMMIRSMMQEPTLKQFLIVGDAKVGKQGMLDQTAVLNFQDDAFTTFVALASTFLLQGLPVVYQIAQNWKGIEPLEDITRQVKEEMEREKEKEKTKKEKEKEKKKEKGDGGDPSWPSPGGEKKKGDEKQGVVNVIINNNNNGHVMVGGLDVRQRGQNLLECAELVNMRRDGGGSVHIAANQVGVAAAKIEMREAMDVANRGFQRMLEAPRQQNVEEHKEIMFKNMVRMWLYSRKPGDDETDDEKEAYKVARDFVNSPNMDMYLLSTLIKINTKVMTQPLPYESLADNVAEKVAKMSDEERKNMVEKLRAEAKEAEKELQARLLEEMHADDELD